MVNVAVFFSGASSQLGSLGDHLCRQDRADQAALTSAPKSIRRLHRKQYVVAEQNPTWLHTALIILIYFERSDFFNQTKSACLLFTPHVLLNHTKFQQQQPNQTKPATNINTTCHLFIQQLIITIIIITHHLRFSASSVINRSQI